MLFFIGVLLILLSIAVLGATKLNLIEKEIKTKQIIGVFIIGILFSMFNFLFFYAKNGSAYFLVSPTGSTRVVNTSGYKWRGFAKITEWNKYMDVKVSTAETDGDEVNGIMQPVNIRFIDQVTADGYVSTRFELPRDEVKFKDLCIKFRTQSNLINNTIIPTVKEQLINTGYMFSAQDYISGESQSFRQTFDDQLKNGSFSVRKKEKRDTVYVGTSKKIKEIRTTYTVEKVMVNGRPKRIPHELLENGIIVSQVIVDDIKLEGEFRKRLQAQRDESAKRQLEQQKIETAKASQQRIIAEGESSKAAERVTQEREQVKTLIAIETKLKQETTQKELAKIKLETAKLETQAAKVKADAKAYENTKLVKAGIDPKVRLQMELNAKIEIAKALANKKVPSTMIVGGKDNSAVESLLMTKLVKDISIK